jgi:hypothetical protein
MAENELKIKDIFLISRGLIEEVMEIKGNRKKGKIIIIIFLYRKGSFEASLAI